jgi:hypothetical protein
LDGYPPLLEVSRAYNITYMHMRESPRDEGFRSVVDLITPLPDPYPKHMCVMGSVPPRMELSVEPYRKNYWAKNNQTKYL